MTRPFAESSNAFRSFHCNISRPYLFSSTLRGTGWKRGSYERGIADRLDEGAYRLCPFGRARSHQPANGSVDAGLFDARATYGAWPGADSERIEARRH